MEKKKKKKKTDLEIFLRLVEVMRIQGSLPAMA